MKKTQPHEGAELDPDPREDSEELDTATDRPPRHREPEVSTKTEALTSWDSPADSEGMPVPKVRPDDETAVGEILVEEGVEEADRDQRIAAADEDFEP